MAKMLKKIPSNIACITCTHADEINKRRVYFPTYEESEHVDYRDVIDYVVCSIYDYEKISPAVSCENYERAEIGESEPDVLPCVDCNNACGYSMFEINLYVPSEMRVRDIYCLECDDCSTPPCVECTRYRSGLRAMSSDGGDDDY